MSLSQCAEIASLVSESDPAGRNAGQTRGTFSTSAGEGWTRRELIHAADASGSSRGQAKEEYR